MGAGFRPDIFEEDYVLLNVMCAMVCTFIAFSFIFIVDWLCHIDPTLEELDEALRKLYRVFGVVVGFSWEQTFDEAEEAMAMVTPDPQASKVIMAIISIIVLIPAWRWYVLPMVYQGGWKFGFVCDHVI